LAKAGCSDAYDIFDRYKVGETKSVTADCISKHHKAAKCACS